VRHDLTGLPLTTAAGTRPRLGEFMTRPDALARITEGSRVM
jgi:hypothetical protein